MFRGGSRLASRVKVSERSSAWVGRYAAITSARSCTAAGLGVHRTATRSVLCALGVSRRGGYRDRESQAFIESWFSKLKERLIWRMEFETLEQLRAELAAYVERYHDRPHSGLAYLTPKEVHHTWDNAHEQPLKLAA
jgi:transposase InsO family protein